MGKLIYQKCLVSIPSHGSVVWVKIITFLLSFNGDRSFFLSDEDLSVRLILVGGFYKLSRIWK